MCEKESSLNPPRSNPRLCVHFQATSPEAVLLGRSGQETPLGGQLLSQGTDVIGFESAAASDIADAGSVRFPGVFLHVPSGQDPRLQSCGRTVMEECVVMIFHHDS